MDDPLILPGARPAQPVGTNLNSWNPFNNQPIDPAQLAPPTAGGEPWWLKLLGGMNPYARGAIATAGVMEPTPAETGEIGTNLPQMRPSYAGPTEDLSAKPAPAPADAPMPPVRPEVPPAVHKAVVAAGKAAAKAAQAAPRTAGAPNLGYYAPHGRDREWIPYSRLPNGGADDPRIYRGPLQ